MIISISVSCPGIISFSFDSCDAFEERRFELECWTNNLIVPLADFKISVTSRYVAFWTFWSLTERIRSSACRRPSRDAGPFGVSDRTRTPEEESSSEKPRPEKSLTSLITSQFSISLNTSCHGIARCHAAREIDTKR